MIPFVTLHTEIWIISEYFVSKFFLTNLVEFEYGIMSTDELLDVLKVPIYTNAKELGISELVTNLHISENTDNGFQF